MLGLMIGWASRAHRTSTGESRVPAVPTRVAGEVGNEAIPSPIDAIAIRDPRKLAVALTAIRISPEQLRRCILGLDAKERDRFFIDYIRALSAQAPWDLGLILKAFPLASLSTDVQVHLIAAGWQRAPEAVAEWVAGVSDIERIALLNKALYHTTSDLRAANAFVRLVAPEHMTKDAAEKIAYALGEDDPQRAIRIVEKCQPAAREAALTAIYEESIAKHPVADAQALLSILDGVPAALRPAIAAELARNSSADLKGSVALLESLPEEEKLAALKRLISQNWQQFDLEGSRLVLRRIIAAGGDVENERLAVETILHGTAMRDLDESLALVSELPAGKYHDALIEQLINDIARDAPETLMQKLDALPTAAARDLALIKLSKSMMHDLPSALDFAASIQGSADRQRAVRELLQAWQSVDEKFAAQVMKERNLSLGESEAPR